MLLGLESLYQVSFLEPTAELSESLKEVAVVDPMGLPMGLSVEPKVVWASAFPEVTPSSPSE